MGALASDRRRWRLAAGLTVAMSVVWCVSGWWSAGFCRIGSRMDSVGIGAGHLQLFFLDRSASPRPVRWVGNVYAITSRVAMPGPWVFKFAPMNGGFEARIALPWLIIPMGLWSGLCARRCARRREGECRRCGYSLRGLGGGVRCPECGGPIEDKGSEARPIRPS